MAHHLAGCRLDHFVSFATLTLLTKNSFLDEIKKQYVMTARAKGLTERRVLYGHVFRNAMLIVIAGFPALFVAVFFGGIADHRDDLFAGRSWASWAFDAARCSATIRWCSARSYAFGLMGLVIGILSDLMYVWVDPRIDFERTGLGHGAVPAQPAAAGAISRPTGAPTASLWLFIAAVRLVAFRRGAGQ
ncbi:MAG: ABC transporter permease subunit [Cypionkella sp.]